MVLRNACAESISKIRWAPDRFHELVLEWLQPPKTNFQWPLVCSAVTLMGSIFEHSIPDKRLLYLNRMIDIAKSNDLTLGMSKKALPMPTLIHLECVKALARITNVLGETSAQDAELSSRLSQLFLALSADTMHEDVRVEMVKEGIVSLAAQLSASDLVSPEGLLSTMGNSWIGEGALGGRASWKVRRTLANVFADFSSEVIRILGAGDSWPEIGKVDEYCCELQVRLLLDDEPEVKMAAMKNIHKMFAVVGGDMFFDRIISNKMEGLLDDKDVGIIVAKIQKEAMARDGKIVELHPRIVEHIERCLNIIYVSPEVDYIQEGECPPLLSDANSAYVSEVKALLLEVITDAHIDAIGESSWKSLLLNLCEDIFWRVRRATIPHVLVHGEFGLFKALLTDRVKEVRRAAVEAFKKGPSPFDPIMVMDFISGAYASASVLTRMDLLRAAANVAAADPSTTADLVALFKSAFNGSAVSALSAAEVVKECVALKVDVSGTKAFAQEAKSRHLGDEEVTAAIGAAIAVL